MTKQDIINYVMTTPHNTNKAILNDMLDQMINDSGSGSDFDIQVITIPVTHNIPEGAVIDHAYGDMTLLINGEDFTAENGVDLTESLEAVVVEGYCKVRPMTCYVDTGYCWPSNVVTTGNIEWDSNTYSLYIRGEGTITITWVWAD